MAEAWRPRALIATPREILATRRISGGSGPLQPSGDPLLSGVGPAAYAERSHEPELTREGHDLIVPIRVAHEFAVCAGPDPRGWQVLGSDARLLAPSKICGSIAQMSRSAISSWSSPNPASAAWSPSPCCACSANPRTSRWPR